MKMDEHYPLVAIVRQEGLTGRSAAVTFSIRQVQGIGDSGLGIRDEERLPSSNPQSPIPNPPSPVPRPAPPTAWTVLERRTVLLAEPTQTVEISYVPQKTGRFVFRVEAERFPEEVLPDNNRAETEAIVHDNPLRLLYVEYDPTWEWRFVKEVFYRDRLIGKQGFRTFLHSAHPKVQISDEVFVPSLNRPRSEFFAHDVIILGDVPAAILSTSFCQMVEEFVDKLGGGLVVLSGPRFGPGQLAQTRLADMLPVKVDASLRIRDRQPFALRRTAEAAAYDFMRLAPKPPKTKPPGTTWGCCLGTSPPRGSTRGPRPWPSTPPTSAWTARRRSRSWPCVSMGVARWSTWPSTRCGGSAAATASATTGSSGGR